MKIYKKMIINPDSKIGSLGIETKEILGFKTEQELEMALQPLLEISEDNQEHIIKIFSDK